MQHNQAESTQLLASDAQTAVSTLTRDLVSTPIEDAATTVAKSVDSDLEDHDDGSIPSLLLGFV